MGLFGWFGLFETEGSAKIFMILWVGANVLVFFINFTKFGKDEYAYLRKEISYGLQVARGAANILNLNCALILLPVCRNLVNFTRGCFECKRSIRRLFDKNITFHKWCAYAIVLASIIHIAAHCFNVQRLVETNGFYEPTIKASDSWEIVLFTSPAGITGVIITVCLILIVSSAMPVIRRSYFELFWVTHHLFLIFYAAMLVHGTGGFVRHQTNYPSVPIETEPSKPGSWMWLVGPLFIYVSERLYRFYKSQMRPLKVTKIVKHYDKSPVLEIQMTKIGTKAGQYIFLHCPALSQVEWHPFTLTSCPELDYISVHVRLAGDWTEGLAEQCGFNCCSFRVRSKHNPERREMQLMLKRLWPHRNVNVVHVLANGMIQHSSDVEFKPADLDKLKDHPEVDPATVNGNDTLMPHLLPTMAVDGPFGTCSEDVYRFEAAVLVGAGIGVTPYASILQALYFRACRPKDYTSSKTKKVYFYWLCPGFDAWGWFASLLMDLEAKLEEIGLSEFLSIRVFMTRGWTDNDAARIMLHDMSEDNAIVRDDETGRSLKHKMNFGRPMWAREFQGFCQDFPGADVGVFFCGPAVLSSTLHEQCIEATTGNDSRGTRFFYHKENF